MTIKDPQHNRLYAIACLTDELARLRAADESMRDFHSRLILDLATALYDMALTEEQWQEREAVAYQQGALNGTTHP